MADEEYGQFMLIDINDDILKYKPIKPKHLINNTNPKEKNYYHEHYHLTNNEYRSNNTLTTIDSSILNDKDIAMNAYIKTKLLFLYFTIFFTSAWSVYLIFTL
tara:strand:- start:328 stop:636 length:309 start_codon:yes stop_codon:yes gene_type:complete